MVQVPELWQNNQCSTLRLESNYSKASGRGFPAINLLKLSFITENANQGIELL